MGRHIEIYFDDEDLAGLLEAMGQEAFGKLELPEDTPQTIKGKKMEYRTSGGEILYIISIPK